MVHTEIVKLLGLNNAVHEGQSLEMLSWAEAHGIDILFTSNREA